MDIVFFDIVSKEEKYFFNSIITNEDFIIKSSDSRELNLDLDGFSFVYNFFYKENRAIFGFDTDRKMYLINELFSFLNKPEIVITSFNIRLFINKFFRNHKRLEDDFYLDKFKDCFLDTDSRLVKLFLIFTSTLKTLDLIFEDLCSDPFLNCWEYSDVTKKALDIVKQEEHDNKEWLSKFKNNEVNGLFCFDIECANCFDGIGKICEFGFAWCENLQDNVKTDIYFINPESEFALKGVDHGKDLRISKPYDFYKTQKSFLAYDKSIRKNFDDQSKLIIGYAVKNDISFLQKTALRYELTNFSFKAFDIQKLFKKMHPELGDNVQSLSNAYNYLFPDSVNSVFFHSSDEDAKATLLIALKLFEGKSIGEIVVNNLDCVVNSKYFIEKEENPLTRYSVIPSLRQELAESNLRSNIFHLVYKEKATFYFSLLTLYALSNDSLVKKNIFNSTNPTEAKYIVVLNKFDKDNLLALIPNIDKSKIIFAKDFIGMDL